MQLKQNMSLWVLFDSSLNPQAIYSSQEKAMVGIREYAQKYNETFGFAEVPFIA